MKKMIRFASLLSLLVPVAAIAVCNPFSPGTVLTASALNNAIASPCITSGTIDGVTIGGAASTTISYFVLNHQTPMRVAPTGIVVSTAGHLTANDLAGIATTGASAAFVRSSNTATLFSITTAAVFTAYRPMECYFNNSSGYLALTGGQI